MEPTGILGNDDEGADSDSAYFADQPLKGNSDKDLAKKRTGTKRSSSQDVTENERPVLECSVCLQPCQFPVQLPCNHIFCFLCVKGVVSRNKGCALCRQPIPTNYLCKPNLLYQEMLQQTVMFDDGYSWFYEGTNGWWLYDDRTSTELEMHHKAGHSSCELLIAGFVYIIDLINMFQFRRHNRTKKRRVKRDLTGIQGQKGIAGLRIAAEKVSATNDRPGADGRETNSTSVQQWRPIRRTSRPSGRNSSSPSTSHNTPQAPMTPSVRPPTNGPTAGGLVGPLQRLGLTDDGNSPSFASPHNGSVGSSGTFNSPDSASPSVEDISASRQQLQSDTSTHDFQDVTEDGEDPADRDRH